MNSPILKVTPSQRDQGKQQQHAKRRRGPGERRARDCKFKREWDGWQEVFGECARDNFVIAGRKFFHCKLRIMRQFFSNDLSGTVVQGEGVLKLLGKGAAANRRDVEQQTVLWIIQCET